MNPVANAMMLIVKINQKTGWAGSAPWLRPYFVIRDEIMAARMVNPVIMKGIIV